MRRNLRRHITATATIATAAIATTAVGATLDGSPAEAALTTMCVGEGGAVTVSGDLVVPANETCVLEGTTVNGDVRVASGANLIATSATVGGKLTVRTDAWADLTSTTVGGRVALVDSYGFYGDGSQLHDNIMIRRTDESIPSGMLLAFESAVAGNVVALDGDVSLESSTVSGNVFGKEAAFVDLFDSAIDGNLRVTETSEGSIVCDSEVYGKGVFAGNGGPIQLGGPGTFGDCHSAAYWDGDVVVADNAGGVSLHDNIVRGNLRGNGNDPAPTGQDNRVRGNIWGQFTDLAPAAPAITPKARTAATGTDADRSEPLERAAEQRTKSAVDDASRIGPADL